MGKAPLKLRLLARLMGGGSAVDKINALWDWLNGKKTAIGSVILALGFLAAWLPEALPAFGVAPELALKITGVVGVVLGLAHKLYKALFRAEPPISIGK